MLSKLPIVVETPFIAGTPGQEAYTWCPPPTPPPAPPTSNPWFAGLPGVRWNSGGCWIDHQVFLQAMFERGIHSVQVPPGCVFYNLPPPGQGTDSA